MGAVAAHDIGVAVPVQFSTAGEGAVEKLHDAHALLQQASGEQAVAGVFGFDGVAGRRAVGFERFDALAFEVHEAGDAALHAPGEFVAADAGSEVGVVWMLCQMLAVQRGEQVHGGAAGALFCGGTEILRRFVGAEGGALKGGGQEAAAPVVRPGLRTSARVCDGDEARQVFIERPERVSRPRTKAGITLEGEAGGEKVLRLGVGAVLRGERVDEANVVSQPREMWHEVGNHLAALTAWFEVPERFCETADGAFKRHLRRIRRHFPVLFIELRLVVERIEVADRSGAEDQQHLLRLRRKM